MNIALTSIQLQIVQDILGTLLPPDAEVWVFGSRANGRVKRSSDLDLAIDAGRALSAPEMGALPDAFDESDLPFEVDVVDWQGIEDSFKNLITNTRVNLLIS